MGVAGLICAHVGIVVPAGNIGASSHHRFVFSVIQKTSLFEPGLRVVRDFIKRNNIKFHQVALLCVCCGFIVLMCIHFMCLWSSSMIV